MQRNNYTTIVDSKQHDSRDLYDGEKEEIVVSRGHETIS